MPRTEILVLYEDARRRDRRGRRASSYPLHDLVLRCMEDRSSARGGGLRFDDLKAHVAANPRKGIDRVLDDLQRGVWNLRKGPVFALVDDDRGVRERLGLGSDASWAAVLARLEQTTAWKDVGERVFGLRRNLESLLEDAVRVGKNLPGYETIRKAAIGPKNPMHRDGALQILAFAWSPADRARLLERQPGLSGLVDALIREVARVPDDGIGG